jgi:hypothetical protein
VPAGLSNVVAIAAGDSHSLALKADGTVVAWGYNNYGQTNVPAGLSNVAAIAGGWAHSLALKNDGTVVAWGDNADGQTDVPAGLSNVVAIAAGGFHSLALALVVPVVIERGPSSRAVAIGATVDFSVQAIGSPPLIYQWYFNNTNALNNATNALLELTNVEIAQSGAYAVVVTNACTAVTSAPAILTVTNSPPSIVSLSMGQMASIGATVEFAVTAAGTPPLGYQWFFNVTNGISGANGSVLRLTNIQSSQFGDYTVVVANGFGAVTSSPVPLNLASTTVVTNCTETDLRAAIAGGGNVILACDGAITLSNTIPVVWNTVLDGSGHSITISGSNAVRVFYVAPNVSFSIVNLTIANGRSTNGAGLFNDGGLVTLAGVAFRTNVAQTSTGPASEGGGIFNRAGTINATNCVFTGNQASAPSTNFEAHGGAIRNESGLVNLENCNFTANQARGGGGVLPVKPGADGDGGAIHNSGSLSASGCSFAQDSTAGGNGADAGGYVASGTPGGDGNGAAIFNAGGATIKGGTFSGNFAAGGAGGNSPLVGPGGHGGAGAGGAIFNCGSLVVQQSTFANNSAAGSSGGYGANGSTTGPPYPDGWAGGCGGSGNGGAICSQGLEASLILQCSALFSNTCAGGLGARGGWGGTTVYKDGLVGAPGGIGGYGGTGNGGALFNGSGGTAKLINCTLAFNGGRGSSGGQGGNGGAAGGNGGMGGDGGSGIGGICDANGLGEMTNCTLVLNYGNNGFGGSGGVAPYGGLPGSPGANGVAGGGLSGSGSWLINTLLAGNTPTNCSGVITDLGHNLSSDGSCSFTSIGSLNNTDPELGPLADNGGPTLTMALLPGSPAIDAGDISAAQPTDQRGFPRVVGPRIDIGAYELCYLPVLRISPPQTNVVSVLVYGLPDQSCRLMTSSTLANWLCLATNQIGAGGTTVFQDSCGVGQTCRFYRAVIP